MVDFHKLKTAIARQFATMSKHDLFIVGIEKDALWTTYLESFPAGTNPIYRERTAHDCSCCRHFIKTIGNVVAIVDGKLVSVWDCEIGEPAYQTVADALARSVRAHPIANLFMHYERSVGTDKNYENDDGTVKTWEHFHVDIPLRNDARNVVQPKNVIPAMLGEARAQHDVLLRSLTELTMDAVDTVLELIAQNSLYRGEEHRHAVASFRNVKKAFDGISDAARDIFVWSKVNELAGSVSRIRNTAIGTLLIDLSDGMDLEGAVRKFESVVAPQNYKRPVALVTTAMVEKARQAVADLGLTSALERRYASLADISVNNIIFADRSARKLMKDDPFDAIETKAAAPKNLSKVESVPIDKFVTEIVPNVSTIEVMLKNEHVGNLVSLIAPANKNAARLFKWNNNFSWAYNGDFADSIKERVKRAGGNVTGDLCCRLAWYNFDDLDFHMIEPTKNEISFMCTGPSSCGGRLDVDMNAGRGTTRTPVENIFYAKRGAMHEGRYELFVHQFSQRETDNVGFEVEIDYLGQVTSFVYAKTVRHRERVPVATFTYSHARGIEIVESLPTTQASKTVWNLKTNEFHRVNVIMLSPNHWDEQGVGNRHYFFMLDGCQNDGQARGFFNEFLRPELDTHRKVIEILGSKMKTAESVDQLSGLGISSTLRKELLVRVSGNFTRTLNIVF